MIKIYKQGIELNSKRFLFPAGEVGVKLDTENLNYYHVNRVPPLETDKEFEIRSGSYQTIVARINDSNDFMELVMVTDALRHFDPTPIRLVLPYVSYGRQDRVCVKGESFSLKAYASLINSMNFERVTIFDPHSEVTPALINNVKVITQFDIISKFDDFAKRILKPNTVFVAPDAGSNKKTSELAKYFSHKEFIRADKLRDLATGNIKETIVYADDLTGMDVVICDDIGDGMRTFVELAKVLKAKKANKIILYITHGIFSKGSNVLFDGGIDEVYTTNSFYDVFPAGISEQVKVFKIESMLSL